MKILYDINQQRVNQYIKDYILNTFEDVVEVTELQVSSIDFIFTCVNNQEDVKELRKREIPEHTLIVVLSNAKIAFELLELYPLCYIRVDELEKDLEKCCSLIKALYDREEVLLSFKIKNSVLQLKSSNIQYIESFAHYLTIHTVSGEYTVRDTLSKVIKRLPPNQFIQVHKSYIVNKKYIKKITTNEVTLHTVNTIPIGNKYKRFIKDIEF